MHIVSLLLIIAVQTRAEPDVDSCAGRSETIAAIKNEDQLDRQDWLKLTPAQWKQVEERDQARRQAIGEIFAAGCLKTAADYSNAALVFQHGSVADHAFQAYLWAKAAVELGQRDARWLMAAGLDRYLMDKGYKQIYASQASLDAHECYCLWPVEASSTDADRRKMKRASLAEQLRWVDALNDSRPSCGPPAICAVAAKPAPRGSLPGVVW